MFKCILLDDELLALSYLRTLCEEHPKIDVVRVYNHPKKLLEEIKELTIDFIISDIVMPEINGIQLSEFIKNTPIIYVSAHNDFAVDAFDVNAVDYIKKPIDKTRLYKALEKVIKQIETKTEHKSITLSTHLGETNFNLNEIVYITTSTIDRRDKILFLNTGNQFILKNYSLDELLQTIHAAEFIRINKKEIINKNYISSKTTSRIYLNNQLNVSQKEFQLGEKYSKMF